MDSSIITQSVLQAVQFSLQQDTDNLAAHANMLMSRAHGWNLLWIASGTTDSFGNPIDKYYDDHGNAIGDYSLVIPCLNPENIFYAPALDSTLPAQNAFTGMVDPGYGVPVNAGVSQDAWITELDESAATSDTINDTLLVPHSRLGMWEAHGAITVWVQPTYDSTGNQIGTHVANFYFSGQQYQIPCTPRIGGMMRLLQVAPWNSNHVALSMSCTKDGSAPLATNATPINHNTVTASFTGTFPITLQWQYQGGGGNWTNFDPSSPHITCTNNPLASFTCAVTGTDGITFGITYIYGAWNEGDINTLTVRFIVTASATNQTVTSQPFTFSLNYVDDDDDTWFCSEANRTKPFSPEEWALVRQIRVACFKAAPRLTANYIRFGKELVARMRQNGVTSDVYVHYVQELLTIARTEGLEAAARYDIWWCLQQVNTHWPLESGSSELYHRRMGLSAKEAARFS